MHLLETLLILCLLIYVQGAALNSQQWLHGRDLANSTSPWIETLSWKPRAFLYHNLLSPEEADHLITVAKPFVSIKITPAEQHL
jgi:hypothetical protein